jgi:UDP-2,3-diacylglucosamine pyrophosphatase LpxH
MSIFCVSDLHLADRGFRDNFAVEGREERFHKFLDYVAAEGGQLYVLGDLFDFWRANPSRIVVAYLDLLTRLDKMQAVYVVGNHDCAFSAFIGQPGLMPGHPLFLREVRGFEKTIGGRRFAFLHGHESDPYCRDLNPGTGEITAIISAMLEDRNRGPFTADHHAVEDQFVGTLEAALTLWRHLTFQHGRRDELLDGVEAYRKEAGADVVVYGHTHEAGHIGDYHFNAGTWARTNDTFVRINDDGRTAVWEWLPSNRPALFPHALR